MFLFWVSLIDFGREGPLIGSDSCSLRWCNSSGHNISTLYEAGIKMATDEELRADKALIISEEETTEKNAYCSVVCFNPLMLGHLEGSGMGNSLAIWINLNKCILAKVASKIPAETIVLGETVLSFKPSSCWHRPMKLSWRTKLWC